MTSAKQICSPDKIAEEVYVSVVAYAAEVSPRKRPHRSENCALGVLVFEVGVFGAARKHRIYDLPTTVLAELCALGIMPYLYINTTFLSMFFSRLPARWTRCGR